MILKPVINFYVRLQLMLHVFSGVVPGSLIKVKSQIQVNSGTVEMALGVLYPQTKTMWTGKAQLLALTQYLTTLGTSILRKWASIYKSCTYVIFKHIKMSHRNS